MGSWRDFVDARVSNRVGFPEGKLLCFLRFNGFVFSFSIDRRHGLGGLFGNVNFEFGAAV